MFSLCITAVCQPTIVTPPDTDEQVRLAAKEVRRYVYLRTDQLLEVKTENVLPATGDVILIARERHPLVQSLREAIGGNAPENGFLIKSGCPGAIVMGDPNSIKLHWRPLGEEKSRTAPCHHIARGVYRVSLPPQQ